MNSLWFLKNEQKQKLNSILIATITSDSILEHMQHNHFYFLDYSKIHCIFLSDQKRPKKQHEKKMYIFVIQEALFIFLFPFPSFN